GRRAGRDACPRHARARQGGADEVADDRAERGGRGSAAEAVAQRVGVEPPLGEQVIVVEPQPCARREALPEDEQYGVEHEDEQGRQDQHDQAEQDRVARQEPELPDGPTHLLLPALRRAHWPRTSSTQRSMRRWRSDAASWGAKLTRLIVSREGTPSPALTSGRIGMKYVCCSDSARCPASDVIQSASAWAFSRLAAPARIDMAARSE